MVAAINLRRYSEERKENSRFGWLGRTLSQFEAAGYMVEKGQENKALKQAEMVAYDEVEAALLGNKPKSSDPHENSIGSYERFMGQWGQMETRGKQM
jgi:hypothetical protein